MELFSYFILKRHFGEFSLTIQGNTTMVESPYQVWEHPSNYTSWSGLTHFNNLGFRRFEDVEVEKPADTVRIFIMGGSAAFGSQAMPGSIFLKLSGQGEYSTDETISAYLQDALQKKYPSKKFEVINAATNWSRIHQQLLHYCRKIRSLSPDLIISIDGQNDSHSTDISLNAWDETVNNFQIELLDSMQHKLRAIFKNSYSAYLMAMLIFRSTENDSIESDLVEKYAPIIKPDNFDETIAEYYMVNNISVNREVEEYLKNLQYFEAILNADGVPHVFFLQPQTIMDTSKILTRNEKAIQGYLYSRIDKQYFRINFFKRLEKESIKLRGAGLPFFPIFDVFSGKTENAYSDYCHFTPAGNRVIAQYLMSFIENNHKEILNP